MKVLFISRHNTCRSILAEAVAKRFLPAHFHIASAGSDPKGELPAFIQTYLSAMGLNPADYRSKSWEEFSRFHPDIVISVGDSQHGEPCPNWLADGIRVNWDLPNPLTLSQDPDEQEKACEQTALLLKHHVDTLSTLPIDSLSAEEIKTKLSQTAL
ncbi:arsenate reductase ArsC [Photobacterium sp. WH24]|uniref:Arsenate reductase ArsC n=1 Tax=Photobacterium arenosum TaxID=2774143 RepID=A0ABR9BKV9_9GAMM|nr:MULTISPECIES: arsenate reductase ArsC [Photobacterium]MBD8512287.1 arsenate reductase ArsC [Photobacterium arenosum]MBV7260648.1 arsenate reductase ArsC [Photobacterium sp. WH24]